MENLSIEELQSQLQEAKDQANRDREAREKAEAAAKAAQEALKKSGAPLEITGSYEGRKFVTGHTKVRDKQGRIGDSQAIMDAANAGDAEAQAILNWLIKINYAYLVPVDSDMPAPKKAKSKAAK